MLSRDGHRDGESGQVAGLLPQRLAVDRQRPQYHFLPKANWVNGPNGPIYWKGYCHLFYQYSSTVFPQGPEYWGHARSRDMVQGVHIPIASFKRRHKV
jgi:sucrose-6-phosphate hydrolase SacC (GH32 family)